MENNKTIENCDVLILGAGMAAFGAALYTVRYNLKTIIVGKDIGGTGNIAGLVENWPGFMGQGIDLMKNVVDQVKQVGATIIQGEITGVEKDENGYFVELEDKIVHGKSIIITLGMQHKKLNIKGENEFIGKGVSYCAACDGPLFRNKIVTIIGGGDSASKAALYLSEHCKKVYVVVRKGEMKCEPIAIEQMKLQKNIEVLYFTKPVEIVGDKIVKSINLVEDKNDVKKDIKLDTDGVFIEIGAVPMLEVIKSLGLKTDQLGFIYTDKEAKTNVDGVFAAGDNTDTKFKQFVVSAGEGAIAAKSVYDYIRFRYKK
jgi:thioredoxin reductase (NADPH)